MSHPSISAVIDRARAWMRDDPDPADRAEVARLIERGENGDETARFDLTERFSGPLKFGTAGLRGVVGAGETRMNRAVVIRATCGLVNYLIDHVPGARERGIVIGRDARFGSEAFQRDAAEVAAGAGMRVHLVPGPAPTPLVSFAVPKLGAAAGIVVTASHNPPEYNGYKVYLDRGAQIVPPQDAGIAACIERAPAAKDVARKPLEEARAAELITDAGDLEGAYLEAVSALRILDVQGSAPRIAYTALHGVGERFAREALSRAGFTSIESVAEQAEPDGRFPTVRFPNPEEPGALELVLALAERTGADLVLANDPDADRLAAAARDASGRMVVLSGNEIGVLLGHHVLVRDPSPLPDRLVVTTVVSSAQLARIARDLGVRYAETLTGFKWITNRAMDEEKRRGSRFVFGYEEALGYTIGTVARDKDGIGAAVVFAELAADCKARGETVLDRLDRIRREHGLYVSRQRSVTLPGRQGALRIEAAMERLRSAPPAELGGQRVEAVWDLESRKRRRAGGVEEAVDELPPADVLVFEIAGGGRAAVRPSGTEPKIKLYLEVAEELAEGEPTEAAQRRGELRLDALDRALFAAAGL